MNSEMPIVFVIDDDEDVRRALSRLLRSVGHRVETFGSAAEFLKRGDAATQGCLVLDVQMPTLSGLDLQSELARRGIELPIIFLTGHGDVPMAVQALKRGAVDFLTKPYRGEQLLKAVNAALEKARQQRDSFAERQQVRLRFASLTSRERDVLGLVVAGRLNKQIAAELGNCERTVKVHRGRVMQKMQAESVAELTRMVERSGLQLVPRSTPTVTPQGTSPVLLPQRRTDANPTHRL
jgi:FixJ family two-component response regulator